MRFLKTLHGWLGVIVLPWVIIIGLTGLFLNHRDLVMNWLESEAYDEAQFDSWPGAKPVTVETAQALAEGLFQGQTVTRNGDTTYHQREVASFQAGDTQIIVALTTGHYWIKTGTSRVTHAPDGTVLETQMYWDGIFKRLHERGWLTRTFGTWFADITAAAMVVFGLSGIVMFLLPRLRRRKNRLRMRATPTS